MTYIALVVRISPKPNGKGHESCNDQEKWGRVYVARHLPTDLPIRVYRDDLLSGADENRAGLTAFRNDLKNDPPAYVWAVEQSRVARGETLWFTIAAEMKAAGLEELHTNRNGIIRLGDVVAGILAVIYAHERRSMLQKQGETLAERAASGEPPGSRPFGYVRATNDKGRPTYAVVPAQADAIRLAAERVLAGWSLENVARAAREAGVVGAHTYAVKDSNGEPVLDAAGVPLRRPGVITPSAVRGWLTNASVAGLRTHKGQIVGPGNWPAILDEDTWRRVGAQLSGPRTVQRVDGGTYDAPGIKIVSRRRYLLTGGLAVCGGCGAPLAAQMKQLKNHRKPYYGCTPQLGGRGCVGINADFLEEHVVNYMFDLLDQPGVVERLTADVHAERRNEIIVALRKLDGRRNELADLWGDGDMTREEWRRARGKLIARERDLKRELADIAAPEGDGPSLAEAREAWPDATLDERRRFLDRTIEKVTLHRSPNRRGLDSERIEVIPRDR